MALSKKQRQIDDLFDRLKNIVEVTLHQLANDIGLNRVGGSVAREDIQRYRQRLDQIETYVVELDDEMKQLCGIEASVSKLKKAGVKTLLLPASVIVASTGASAARAKKWDDLMARYCTKRDDLIAKIDSL